MGALRHGFNALAILIAFAAIWVTGREHQAGSKQAASIRENVASTPGVDTLTDFSVSIDGTRRTAVLRGKVDTNQERWKVTESALRTRGLLTVFNEVEVDAIIEELLIDLRELAEDDPTIGDFNYRIHADNHTVSIDGWVQEDQPQRIDQLAKLVADVPGIRTLQNNMRVGRPDDDLSRVQELIFNILRLGNIYFDYNKATIRPESRDSVEKIAGVLQEYPKVNVRVEGHTDSIASEAYNQRLSEARADSVKNALVELGVGASRIESVGLGELHPVAPNDTPEGRADNRRIEFKVLKPAGAGE